MDELPEFKRNVLEVLRQPLEGRLIIKFLSKYCQPEEAGLSILKNAMEKLDMLARAYNRILKVSSPYN